MKKFFKTSSSLIKPVSFLSLKYGKKKDIIKNEENISNSTVEIKEDNKSENIFVNENIIVEENVIQQEVTPLDETVVGRLDSLEMNNTLNSKQALMVNTFDEVFSSSVLDAFMNPDPNVLQSIQLNVSQTNNLKHYQYEEKDLSQSIPSNKPIQNVMHSKIDNLEKSSLLQSLEIEELRRNISECLTRLASLESSLKVNKTNNSNNLNMHNSAVKGKDITIRKSMVSPRTPMKNLRLSGTPTRRSVNDLSKIKQNYKRHWKPPGGTVVIYGTILTNKQISKTIESIQPRRLTFKIFKPLHKSNNHFTTPWRPAGVSLLFCNLSKCEIRNPTIRTKSSLPIPVTSHLLNSRYEDKTVIAKVCSIEKNHKETTFLKGEGALKIFLKGRPINLYAPSNVAESFDMKATLPEPDESLQMEWVYGYRGKDCRKNIYYLRTGDLVYFVAGIVILHNLNQQTQRHYIEHTDDIKCLALHPDKVTFASGQVTSHSKTDGKPHVRIWSSISLETLQVIGLGFFERAVAAVAFSKSDGGNLLCTVDEANDHNVTLWNWSKKNSLSTAKSSTEAVVEVEFHPKDSNIIVTCGKNHLSFWIVEKNNLIKKSAIYEKNEKPKFVTCITFTEDGDLISGDSSGNIFFWNKDRRAIVEAIDKAHSGPIFALLVTDKKTLLSGGGKDNLILEWDLETKSKSGKNIQLKGQFGCCRAICQSGNDLLVGTTTNCILNITGNECEPILEGHSEELWSLYNYVSKELFVSASFDKKIIVWDAETHKTLSTKQMDKSIYSIGLSSVSDLCVVGFAEGHWDICSISSGVDIHQGRDGTETIQCCEFSPDGSKIALGSRDNYLYIYKMDDTAHEFMKMGKCVGHSSFITHMDWSSDNKYIRTNSGDYELLFWIIPDCKQVKTSSTLADVSWVTCNCTISFEVAGIWPEGSDGTDINAVTKAHNKPVMATADDFGKVNLYRYPASQPKAGHKVYGGHSSHVTGVKFLHDDRRLTSIGGQDTAIVQWLLV